MLLCGEWMVGPVGGQRLIGDGHVAAAVVDRNVVFTCLLRHDIFVVVGRMLAFSCTII